MHDVPPDPPSQPEPAPPPPQPEPMPPPVSDPPAPDSPAPIDEPGRHPPARTLFTGFVDKPVGIRLVGATSARRA